MAFPLCYNRPRPFSLGRGAIGSTPDFGSVTPGSSPGATARLVVGPEAAEVRAALGERGDYVVQPQPLGTADAVRHARGQLQGQCDALLVSYADMPLLRAETLRALVQAQSANRGALTL